MYPNKLITLMVSAVLLPAMGGVAAQAAAVASADSFVKPGFEVVEHKGRMWVFRESSPELAEFRAKGAPAKHIVRPAAGPNRTTLRGIDSETLNEYIATKPGFVVIEHKGSLWVFREGSSELTEFRAQGAPAKHVVRPAAGPMGMTLRAVDAETIGAYLSQ